jgi:hypothetical protein
LDSFECGSVPLFEKREKVPPQSPVCKISTDKRGRESHYNARDVALNCRLALRLGFRGRCNAAPAADCLRSANQPVS